MTKLLSKNQDESDPTLKQFLDFLEQDMVKHPQQIKVITSSTVQRIQSLIDDMSIDLDESLELE